MERVPIPDSSGLGDDAGANADGDHGHGPGSLRKVPHCLTRPTVAADVAHGAMMNDDESVPVAPLAERIVASVLLELLELPDDVCFDAVTSTRSRLGQCRRLNIRGLSSRPPLGNLKRPGFQKILTPRPVRPKTKLSESAKRGGGWYDGL